MLQENDVIVRHIKGKDVVIADVYLDLIKPQWLYTYYVSEVFSAGLTLLLTLTTWCISDFDLLDITFCFDFRDSEEKNSG